MEWTHCEKESASGAQYSFMSLSFHDVEGYGTDKDNGEILDADSAKAVR